VRIRIFATPRAAARALAACFAREIAANPRLVIGLPTGRTPIPLYAELSALARTRRIDLSQTTTFNLDEFVGIPGDHPGSYRQFMQRYLFDRLASRPRRSHFLDGLAPDLPRECRRYERAIARAGGIDLQLLGLGANGHVGFNEPAPALHADTHPTRLTMSTRRANAALFGGRVSDVPAEALSMGMATILHARRVILLATGREKARCVEGMLNGTVTPRLPASFLQLHRHAEAWLDRAAASRLG
jgi:glucosamine-6-phosphate deaminase